MRRGRSFERLAFSIVLVVALFACALQLVADRPVVGALGLLLLAIPGYAISRTIGPRPLGWPEVLLVTLGSTLALTVLVGIVAALTPLGLDARTIAALELSILAAISIAWRRRIVRGDVDAPRRHTRRRMAPGTLLLAGLGLIFAATGVAIATRAAEDQPHPGFVQFWSLPARPSTGATVGVRNMAGVQLDCAVTIDRPERDVLRWDAGTLAPGETVTTLLPQADPTEAAPWRLALECTGASGTAIERQVSINPPR